LTQHRECGCGEQRRVSETSAAWCVSSLRYRSPCSCAADAVVSRPDCRGISSAAEQRFAEGELRKPKGLVAVLLLLLARARWKKEKDFYTFAK